jgi:hypothetical protein
MEDFARAAELAPLDGQARMQFGCNQPLDFDPL